MRGVLSSSHFNANSIVVTVLVAFRLELLHFDQSLSALFVEAEGFGNLLLVPCPARGETLADMVRLFTYQFDVEHGGIMQTTRET